METGQAFIAHSSSLLQDEFFPRIRVVVERLSDEQIWWRPNDASNSIGNLLLHLDGNVTQWLIGGVGNNPVTRDRPKEFSERAIIPRSELLARMNATLDRVQTVFAKLDPAALHDRRVIQGNDVTVLEAIYHVVEHFSMHTGQILMLAKMQTATDLKLYEFPGGAAQKKW